MPKTFTQWLEVRMAEDAGQDFARKAAEAALKAAKNPTASGSQEIQKAAEDEIKRITTGPNAGSPEAAQAIAKISQTMDKTQSKPTAAEKLQKPNMASSQQTVQ